MAPVDSIPSQPILSHSTIALSPLTKKKEAQLFVAWGLGLVYFIFCKPHPGKQELPTKCLPFSAPKALQSWSYQLSERVQIPEGLLQDDRGR